MLKKFAHATGMMLGAPEIAVIETTNRCNLDCIMCYKHEHLKETGDIDFELFKQIAQAVKGARHICCHGGGEPLLHPRIVEMINYVHDTCHPETLSITTNGTLLDRKMAAKLRVSKLNTLFVSIDGASKETFESIRGTSFERVVENVRYFKSISKIPTVIQCTVMKQNLASLPGLPKLVSHMGAERINVQHLLSWNVQAEKMRILDLYDEFKRVREQTMQEAEQYRIECNIPPIPQLDRCDLPFSQVYFNFKGGIAPCCVAIHITLEKSFRKINGRNIKNWRRRAIQGDWPDECRRFCYVT